MASRQRQTVRSKQHPRWRDQLRVECLERVKQNRTRVLQKLRENRLGAATTVQESMLDILDDVASSINPQQQPSQPGSLQPQHQAEPKRGRLHWDVQELDHEDYEQLMSEMEATLFEETSQEDLQRVEEAELAEMAEKYMEHCRTLQSGAQEPVLCPVCQRAYLTEFLGSVHCPIDGFQIKLPFVGDRTSALLYVKDMMAEILAAHCASGCGAKPRFYASEQYTGISTLFMCCDGCKELVTVL